MNGGGAKRGETQNPKQAPGPELSAHSPTESSNPWTMRSWPELKSYTHWLSHPGAPKSSFNLIFILEQAGEREEEQENLKQASRSAQHRARGGELIPWPWDHDLSRNRESDAQLTRHPGSPPLLFKSLIHFEYIRYGSNFILSRWLLSCLFNIWLFL